MDRSLGMSYHCKITDHSILVWINQLYCTIFLLRFHSRSNCINMVQSFRSHPVMIKSNKETEVAQKTKPLAINWQKIKQFYKAWMTDLPCQLAQASRWHWHWKVWHISMTFAVLTMLRQDGDCATVVNRSFIWYFNDVGGSGGNLGTWLGLGNVDCTSWLKVGTGFLKKKRKRKSQYWPCSSYRILIVLIVVSGL